MQPDSCVEFPPFRLDLPNHELWRGEERLALRPKPFAVLAYLATHPKRLVAHAELVRAVWPDTHVGAGLLRGYVRDLRTVLGDDPEEPRFIETVARLGYRFVAPVRERARDADGDGEPGGGPAPDLVGRAGELAELGRRLAAAMGGARQIVFVTGEPGIGKTTLVDAFVARATRGRVWTARGQCIEHFGAGEAYLPVLEALGRLARTPGCERLVAILARHAPTWLVQMPALVADDDLEAVQRRVQGATQERMLREFSEASEVLTEVQPLLLVLEDLHWSDDSTLDLLSSLARRRGSARLCIVATYRPDDVTPGTHLAAVGQDLRAHGHCVELPLASLGVMDVGAYLAARFPGQALAPDLAPAIHRATEGNPLFVANLVDDWVARAVIVDHDGRWELDSSLARTEARVPETLRHVIERQLDRLPSEVRQTLEAASVVGEGFSTAAVAAALEEAQERVDDRCEHLAARGLFLEACGVQRFANGAVAGRYEFRHDLYRQALYERLPLARRVRFHRRIGEWAERAHAGRLQEVAAALAVHFERGHDAERAVRYLGTAAQNAMAKHAYRDAAALLGRGIDLVGGLPDAVPEELSLQMALGTALIVTRGYAAPEVERAFVRARALGRRMEKRPELLYAIAGLFRFYFSRAWFPTARELAEQAMRLAEGRDPRLLAVAHCMIGPVVVGLGEFVAGREHLERGVALYDFEYHRWIASQHGDDPGLTSLAFLAIALWLLGYPDQALARSREAQALAERLGSPYSAAFALGFATWVHVRRRDVRATAASSEALLSLATEQGLRFFVDEAVTFQGWTLAEQGQADLGIERIRAGLSGHRSAGVEMGRPSHLALLAEAYGRAGRPDEGLGVLDEAIATAETTGERSFEAELYRLRGAFLGRAARARGQAGIEERADASLRHAIEIARRQAARSFELRAALGLCRLHEKHPSYADARRILADVYAWFTEGFDTPDLREAKAALDAST